MPFYNEIYKVSIQEGAIGFGISGSGPATFSLCKSKEIALKVASKVSKVLFDNGIDCLTYTCLINKTATVILD